LTKTYEFDVKQVMTGAFDPHEYVAIQKDTGEEVRLPEGGNNEFVGQYPEIQKHLKDHYDVDVPLVYRPSQFGDEFADDRHHGTYRWVFKRTEATVIVNDFPRPSQDVAIAWSPANPHHS
jgi:hypothetical protein